MYFRLGGGTVKGVSKPGEIVWSRVFVEDGKLCTATSASAKVVELPQEETERRWSETTPQWPIMHAVLYGVTRDQMMARHKSNHIQVVYAPNEKQAHRACRIKAAMLAELGLEVHLCGDVQLKCITRTLKYGDGDELPPLPPAATARQRGGRLERERPGLVSASRSDAG